MDCNKENQNNYSKDYSHNRYCSNTNLKMSHSKGCSKSCNHNNYNKEFIVITSPWIAVIKPIYAGSIVHVVTRIGFAVIFFIQESVWIFCTGVDGLYSLA